MAHRQIKRTWKKQQIKPTLILVGLEVILVQVGQVVILVGGVCFPAHHHFSPARLGQHVIP